MGPATDTGPANTFASGPSAGFERGGSAGLRRRPAHPSMPGQYLSSERRYRPGSGADPRRRPEPASRLRGRRARRPRSPRRTRQPGSLKTPGRRAERRGWCARLRDGSRSPTGHSSRRRGQAPWPRRRAPAAHALDVHLEQIHAAGRVGGDVAVHRVERHRHARRIAAKALKHDDSPSAAIERTASGRSIPSAPRRHT